MGEGEGEEVAAVDAASLASGVGEDFFFGFADGEDFFFADGLGEADGDCFFIVDFFFL